MKKNEIHILIVEDEPIIAADLEDRLLDMGFVVAGIFTTGEAVLSHFQTSSHVDIVIMDIQLDGKLDGVETAQMLVKQYLIPIIFLTSNSDDITFERAKKTLPAAFLSKPFRGRDLKHAIELAIMKIGEGTADKNTATSEKPFFLKDRVFVKVKEGMAKVLFEDILWIEADDYYSKIVTKTQTFLLSQTLGKTSKTFEELPFFVRVHRSFIVNLDHISHIGEVFLSINNVQIPLGKSYKEDFMRHINKF